jgi:hypothetical protein
MERFGGSLKQVMVFFPDQTPQDVQQRWSLIKHLNGHSSGEVNPTTATEEQGIAEQMPQKREQLESEITYFDELPTFDFRANWGSSKDWDE